MSTCVHLGAQHECCKAVKYKLLDPLIRSWKRAMLLSEHVYWSAQPELDREVKWRKTQPENLVIGPFTGPKSELVIFSLFTDN